MNLLGWRRVLWDDLAAQFGFKPLVVATKDLPLPESTGLTFNQY